MSSRQAHGNPSDRTLAAYCTVTTLFFAWGFITSLVDPLVAAVKGIFSLSDVEAQLSASAFFIAYGVMSFPAAALLARFKSTNTVVLALLAMLAGCLVMLLATDLRSYPVVLLGLFILASGITVLQVAANPLAAVLGAPERSHFRLTLAQAFNSLGTFVGPYLGAVLFLRGVEVRTDRVLNEDVRNEALAGIDSAFYWIAGLIVLLVVFFSATRRLVAAAEPTPVEVRPGQSLLGEAVSSRWVLFGGLAIFCYVGAEVAIGTQMALFLNGPDALDIPLQEAAKLVSLYWGGAMIGRLLGSGLLARLRAPDVLAGAAVVALALCVFVALGRGPAAGYAALSIGLVNSVMFPVIFTITLERSSASQAATAGFLCFSIVGGAAIPPLTGLVSGAAGYAIAFVVPATCYAILVWFALAARRTSPHKLGEIAPMAH